MAEALNDAYSAAFIWKKKWKDDKKIPPTNYKILVCTSSLIQPVLFKETTATKYKTLVRTSIYKYARQFNILLTH